MDFKECYLCGKRFRKSVCPHCGHIDTKFFSEFARPLLKADEITFLYSFDPINFNRLGREVKGKVKLIFLQKKNGTITPMIRVYTKGKVEKGKKIKSGMENFSLLKVKVLGNHPLKPLLDFIAKQNFSKPSSVEYSSEEDEKAEKIFLLEREKERVNKTPAFQTATLQVAQ